MVITNYIQEELEERMNHAEERYGPLASSHEGLGVALEEWDELREAIKSNRPERITHEAYDLAAVLIRLIITLNTNKQTQNRSTK
jgi:NTP pyrophosphatase (non-canonical NTP hydrolase)